MDDRGRGDLAVRTAHPRHLRSRLGSTEALGNAATVNLLGTGLARPARLDGLGLARAMADPDVHLHLYDKQLVFERRKMGHVTAMGATTDDALSRARAAVKLLTWRDDDDAAPAEDGRDDAALDEQP